MSTPTPTPTPTNTVTPTVTTTRYLLPIGQMIYDSNIYNQNNISIYYKGYNFTGKLLSKNTILYEPPNSTVLPRLTRSPTSTPTQTPTPTPTVTKTQTPTVTPTHTTTTTTTITPTVTSTRTPTPTNSTGYKTVAVSLGNSVTVSTNSGQSWTDHTMADNLNWIGITYGANQYVACAYDSNKLNKSTDGTSWTTSYISADGTNSTGQLLSNFNNLCTKIFFGNNKYIILPLSSSVGAISSNGINWSEITFPIVSNWAGVAYGNGVYVILASQSDVAATSSDGVNWTQVSVGANQDWQSLSFVNNKFIAVASDSSTVLTSSNGVNWTSSNLLPNSRLWKKAVYGNGNIVIFSNSGYVAVSTNNGVSYTEYSVYGTNWNDLVYKDGFIMIGDESSVALTSSNGISWTQRTISPEIWVSVA